MYNPYFTLFFYKQINSEFSARRRLLKNLGIRETGQSSLGKEQTNFTFFET